MRDSLLQPGNDVGNGLYLLLRLVSVHFVAEPHVDSTIPEPSDINIDFTVVDLLQLFGEVHSGSFVCRHAAAGRHGYSLPEFSYANFSTPRSTIDVTPT